MKPGKADAWFLAIMIAVVVACMTAVYFVAEAFMDHHDSSDVVSCGFMQAHCGKIQSIDETTVILETDSGVMEIPRAGCTVKHAKVEQ